ncbi:immune inhibitor A [Dactylosporangium vinaceum]|uniref:Immune inhibitor A domain-containing protein n=1 Tax=Dactylosporangium vinaceum TaxID=53362 RepID=A0ABV5MQD1_9ACTN|nr:immune inhibitor A domain-containing protein [Dactylosporangium vinaceum]UAB96501.1 immune inhibitor A [Dactylosporangium vinaceum]
MRKLTVGLLSLTLASGMGVFVGGGAVMAAPVQQAPSADASTPSDELSNPLEDERRESREVALSQVLNGQAQAQKRGSSTVVKIGDKSRSKGHVDKYVELAREKTDKIFVVLAEFGNQRAADYPDQDTAPAIPGPATFDGPLHNAIPQPDRSVDNSTIWKPDFSKQYFENMYFASGNGAESLKTYYEKQSSGRYSVEGQVTDWVKVPYNEARYGRSNGYPCGDNVCDNTHFLIRDAINAWVDGQHAQGKSDADIKATLASYDQWDRFDYDHDGDFNEPDGYIDHFQIVHAGGDQADGDLQQGEDAIWSHRWAAFQNRTSGPDYNKVGGTQIGATGLWVRDYTIQPENGGLSVFAHEYGHDLGLPDHYDTSGASGNAENPVNWWTIMAQSRVSLPSDNGIAARAADLGAWDKLQLGWLDYATVNAGKTKVVDLGPHEYNSKKPQAVVVVLPKKPVTTPLPTPPEGTKSWWSGKGDLLENTLTRSVAVPAGTTTLSFQAYWDTEACSGNTVCDNAYVEVDDGTGFKAIPGSITKATEGNAIDGKSNGWVPATFDLSAFAGKTVGLRFVYSTDENTGGDGFFADDIKITNGSTTVFADGAESGLNGWTAVGFAATGNSLTTEYDNYYIASHRTYESFDKYMKTGPYNFGFADRPKYVEHFPYQTGLLVTYWDTSYSDNNTSKHHGAGEILPIDAHPDLNLKADGTPFRPRVQGFDDPFAWTMTDRFTLHSGANSAPSTLGGQWGNPLFDDSQSYYREDPATNTYYGVKVPKNGVKILVLLENGTSMAVLVTG